MFFRIANTKTTVEITVKKMTMNGYCPSFSGDILPDLEDRFAPDPDGVEVSREEMDELIDFYTAAVDQVNGGTDGEVLSLTAEEREAGAAWQIVIDEDEHELAPWYIEEELAPRAYEGGWRKDDREQLMDEYELAAEEADILVAKLAELEEEEAQDELNAIEHVSYGSYKLLKSAVKHGRPGAVEALATWFQEHDLSGRYWNGECYDADDLGQLYPIYSDEDEDGSVEIIGWELRW